MCEQETFWSLLHNAAHWEFELFLMLVFDVLIGMVAWPFVWPKLKRLKEHLNIHEDKKK